VIRANLGKVALASGDTFTLDMYGDGLIQVAMSDGAAAPVDANGVQVAALVDNSGSIIADGGTITLTAAGARGVVDQAISMKGVVQANSVGTKNGKITLSGGGGAVTVDGDLLARGDDAGETGGAVDVFGEEATLARGATIDVSCDAGGGAARLGGLGGRAGRGWVGGAAHVGQPERRRRGEGRRVVGRGAGWRRDGDPGRDHGG